MNFDNFTIKSQEVVQQAVQTAQQNGNQAIEPEHLLKALLDKGESVVKFVFQKLGVNQQLVAMQLDKALSALPKERRRTLPVARVKRCVAESHRLRKAAR